METMMKLSIIMGGMLFFLCSFIFATDVLGLLARKIWKKDNV
jgi:biotin transporter BioY